MFTLTSQMASLKENRKRKENDRRREKSYLLCVTSPHRPLTLEELL